MVQKPHWFGLADAGDAVRVSFVTVAVWWGLFSLFLFFGVHEKANGPSMRQAIEAGFTQFRAIVLRLRALPVLLGFLVVYWFYIDGVNSVFKLAVGFGLAVGLPSSSLIEALLLTQFVAFPAALLFGWLGERVGPRTGITFGLVVYIGVVIYAAFITRPWQFFVLAVMVGLVQGGTQSLSRSLYARLIPRAASPALVRSGRCRRRGARFVRYRRGLVGAVLPVPVFSGYMKRRTARVCDRRSRPDSRSFGPSCCGCAHCRYYSAFSLCTGSISMA